MSREELISALEALPNPDRAADFWCWWWGKATHDGKLPDRDYIAANIRRGDAPRYTASIDAALQLVPEGVRWRVSGVPAANKAFASCATGSIMDPATKEWDGIHATPAIALCIAALRARQ
jgi:hypothetical protein